MKAIAKLFGVSPHTFYRWMEEHPDLADAREACLGTEEKELVDMLWKSAEGGNVAAAMFLLKARHHYTDRGDAPDQQNVQVNITLPGATKLDEYKARIIAEQPELVKRLEHEEHKDANRIDRA